MISQMKILRFSVILILLLVSSFTSTLIKAQSISPTISPKVSPTTAPSPTYTISTNVDKPIAKPGDDVTFTITAQNTGTTKINNFEIRIPFIREIGDTTFNGESPSFNKVLDSIDYPAGFNSRSWIINTFDPKESVTYALKYKIAAEPKTPNGLIANVTLPIVWTDPAGLAPNKLHILNYIRADIYLNRIYNKSYQLTLPTLQVLTAPISQVNLNSKYLFAGSKTTNLKSITIDNVKSVPNFILESEEVLIEWLQPIDLSGSSTPSQLSNLDQNLITEWGKITFTESSMPFLANKPVKITFKNINLVFAPKIKNTNEIKELTDLKGNFIPGNALLVLELEKLSTTTIVPEIKLDQAVYETDKENIEVIGKVADPKSSISFKIGDENARTLSVIDINTGSFTIPIEVKDITQQIEVSTKYKNGEETKKIVIVRRLQGNTAPTGTNASGNSRTISAPINQITLGLIFAASGLLAIIGGIIYYLYRARNKKSKLSIEVNPIVLNKIGGIGSRSDIDRPHGKQDPSNNIDLISLKNRYSVDSNASHEKANSNQEK